jgi:DNA polymerase-3 subunit gamma/tau
VTLSKLGTEPTAGQSAEELKALQDWAAGLSFPALHRLWQLVLRGHDEVAKAVLPIEAAEMALLRVIHASSLPDPGELARRVASGEGPPAAAPAAPPPAPEAPSGPPADFAGVIALLDANGQLGLAERLRHSARVVRYAPPDIVLSAAKPLPADLVVDLAAGLHRATGQRWKITTDDAAGAMSVREAEAKQKAEELDWVKSTPVVKAALDAFPDAEVTAWETNRRSELG